MNNELEEALAKTKNTDDLMQFFINSGLPAEQITSFKEGAAYGYLMAKRQMVEAIDSRLHSLNTEYLDYTGQETRELEKLRDYIRNVMLWRK